MIGDEAVRGVPRTRSLWPAPAESAPPSTAIPPFAESEGERAQADPGPIGDAVQRFDFAATRFPVGRIVVLKLDHFGDFIIALPALRALREAFPGATIRLVCGRWNQLRAARCGLVDEVRCFDFFAERPHLLAPADTTEFPDPLDVFDAAADGRHDLAIDLRVDEDTRPLLCRIDARLRCGVGSSHRFPWLDIALPDEHVMRGRAGPIRHTVFLAASEFESPLALDARLHRRGSLEAGSLLCGHFAVPPTGRLLAEIGLTLRRHIPGPFPAAVHFDVVSEEGDVVARRTYGRHEMRLLRRHPVRLEFDQPADAPKFWVRGFVTGRPWPGRVEFTGVTIQPLDRAATVEPDARLRPVELHVGEKLSLLVALVRERVTQLYGPATEAGHLAPSGSERLRIAVAPFSNSAIRTWPGECYVELIASLLAEWDCDVTLLGSADQRSEARAMIERLDASRVCDLVGGTTWAELVDELRRADIVICNNSGIAHQAAALGARVLAVYSGSHQAQEWGPRGPRARALMHRVACSPCGFERLADCVADHECMRGITPARVLAEVRSMLAEVTQRVAPALP